jgi:hypothetical protein
LSIVLSSGSLSSNKGVVFEEEELMVCLDSRSLNNRSRNKLQKRRLSQQLSTTPLKNRKKIDDDHIQKMSFFLYSSVQVQQKE